MPEIVQSTWPPAAANVANDSVTNAKLSNVATSTIKGRVTAATGDPEDLTAAQVRTLINVADGANAYVHPNHSGDVTSVADGAQTIANDAVTYAKIQNISAASLLLGRGSAAGSGDPEQITLGTNLSMSGTTLNAAAGATITQATAVFTYPAKLEQSAVITDAAVAATDKIMVSLAGVADTQENANDGLDVDTIRAVPGTGNFTVQMSGFSPFAGSVVINYMRAA